jgi:hypothetical protein
MVAISVLAVDCRLGIGLLITKTELRSGHTFYIANEAGGCMDGMVLLYYAWEKSMI